MITKVDKPFSDEESLNSLNIYARKWFQSNFKELTPPQKFAFKIIKDKQNVLITAPTGSGKTMSGFLSIISRLFDYSLQGKLDNKIYCIYVSPLRSLNNDIYRNLMKPLTEIYEMIRKDRGIDIIKDSIKEVTIGVRTGDTTQKERRGQLLKPPNILVTTPESLAIMINSKKFVENMKSIEFIVIDEIHELANNKRGVHLSLTLERLVQIVGHDITRIGLGATLYPLDEAARFLVGSNDKGEERDCKVIDATWSKKLDAVVESPVDDLIYTDGDKIENALYKRLDKIIKENHTTLIFTNTRSGTERVIFNLKERMKYGEDIAAHHSALSRETRIEVEELLKKGALRCAVTSTSLELGIDIGSIDNVVQLGSPKSVTRVIQRIGRAGHSFKAMAKGEVIAIDRDDLVECAIMLDLAKKRELDSFSIPKNALDVLAQHIVGMSLTAKWNADEAFMVVKRAYPYRNLERNDFNSLLNYLAGNYVGLESRKVYGKIWYDSKENVFGRRGRLAQAIYMMNIGTIPDEVAINVFTESKKWIGSIEEEFMARLKPGDIFALGGKLYEFLYARNMKCYVKEAKTSQPTIPPWFSEQLPLSYELAIAIGKFRDELGKAMKNDLSKSRMSKEAKEILDKLPADESAKKAIYGYFKEQLQFIGDVPTDKRIIVEITRDIGGEKEQYIIFHALFGRRINDALSRAFAVSLGEELDEDVAILVNDNGFVLDVGNMKVSSETIERAIDDTLNMNIATTLKLNIRHTEIMKRKFRHVASRGFMVLRNYMGWKVSVGKQQINSQILLNAVEEMDRNFPLLKETYREIFNDMMDLPRAQEIVLKIRKKEISYNIIETKTPSPFSHKIITFGNADVIMMESKRKYLQKLHKKVMDEIKRKKKADKL
ncbi:MAG: ATP-dependent helicase [Candidatus Micrarchaeaceae archaeon]